MNTKTERELLLEYGKTKSEAAFAEIVRRQLNFVYSVALRLIQDPGLAEDVTQQVFVALAKNAERVAEVPVLASWLHQTTRNIASQTVRTYERRRARENEMAIMTETISKDSQVPWEEIMPHLDKALEDLSDADRDAVLLRYFQNKSAREIGQTLGMSEEAAQKRVTRAVEKLRTIFARHKVTISTPALLFLISANAVQSAPAGLFAKVTTVGTLAGATVAVTATTTLTKMTMTILPKVLATAVLSAAIGTGIYQATQNNKLREQVLIIKKEQVSLTQQVLQLKTERDEATKRLAGTMEELAKRKNNAVELATLRGLVTKLKLDMAKAAMLPGTGAPIDPAARANLKNFAKIREAINFDRTWGKLCADLNLSEENAAILKDLIIERNTAGCVLEISKMLGEPDPATIKSMEAQEKQEKETAEGKLKQLLGDADFAHLQEYEKSLKERGMMSLFKDYLAPEASLSTEQEEQLIKTMYAERHEFKFDVDNPLDNSNLGSKVFSKDDVERRIAEEEQLNQLYLARAQNTLSADQYTAFKNYLNLQRACSASAMRVSAKLSEGKLMMK